MATVACAEAASLPVKMLAKLHRHLQSVSLYTGSIHPVPNYWRRVMEVEDTLPALASFDLRERQSAARLAAADASPPLLVEAWWHDAQLPKCLGGLGLGNQAHGARAARAACVLGVLRTLRESCSLLASMSDHELWALCNVTPCAGVSDRL